MKPQRIHVTMNDGRMFKGDISHTGRHWEGDTSKPAVFLCRSEYYDPMLGFWKTAGKVVVVYSAVAKVERLEAEEELESEESDSVEENT